MKAIPVVEKYMTPSPVTIGIGQSLAKADRLMHDYKIRHLPVLDGGNLVGIISDRDIKMISTLKDVDPETVCVEEAIGFEPFKVSPKAQLNEVCQQMADHKYGSALIVDNNKLVGIFTWIDALNAFQELLETRLKK